MVFDVELTDLYGNVLASIPQYNGLTTSMAVNEDRTGKVVLSHYDPAAGDLIFVAGANRIATLGRMIRIKYRGTTVFWGFIVTPKYSTSNKKVELNCQGPAFRLKHRQLNYNDDVVGPSEGPPPQNPSDWRTMRDIVEAAYDNPDQRDINIPDIGIQVVNVSGPTAPAAFWTQIERGSNNWDKLIEVGKSAYGGEFDIVPYDPDAAELPFDTSLVTPKEYHYADLEIYDQMGVNRTGLDLAEDPDNPGTYLDPYDIANEIVSFLYDDQDPDVSNLADMDWDPDGENVRNQRVALMSSSDSTKRGIRKIGRNITSWGEIGIYSGWDSLTGANVKDVSEDNVAGHALNEVERYGRAPNFFKLYQHIEPSEGHPIRGELGWKPQPFRDYGLGDRILARMRQGEIDSGEIVGRIMKITISQRDASNNVSVELDCVPHMGDLSEISVV